MTTHDQHTEFTHPTDDREVLDYPAAETNPAAAEADPRPTRREHAPLETEVPRESQASLETEVPRENQAPLETEAPAAHTRLETEEEMAADRSTERTASEADGDLFAEDELAGLRARWDNVQAGFVDDPRECVQKADSLVSAVVDQLTAGFSDARSRLEEQWARGEEASTEDLRVALKKYREFFQRLLAV